VRNLCGNSGFPEKSLLIGLKVLKLRLESLHHHGSAEIFVDTGAQDRLTALRQGLKIPISHKAVFDVLRQVSVGIRKRNVFAHASFPFSDKSSGSKSP
jgi:hypothetical protein